MGLKKWISGIEVGEEIVENYFTFDELAKDKLSQ